MANRNFAGQIKTLHSNVVRLYTQVYATGADHPAWMDDSTDCDTDRPPAGDNGRNAGIYGWSRQGSAGKHKVVFQDSYAYLLGCGIVVDKSAADDKIMNVTILSEDVAAEEAPTIDGATVTGPNVEIQIYDEGGNAQEVTDGNIIRMWFDLAVSKAG
jgi:hypothetical protein